MALNVAAQGRTHAVVAVLGAISFMQRIAREAEAAQQQQQLGGAAPAPSLFGAALSSGVSPPPALAPLVVGLLKLPTEAAQIFIMGMVRRDFGVAGLFFLAKQLSAVQVLTSLVTITLFVPCLASATVLWKERGRLESSVILVASWLAAFLVGGVVAHGAGWLHL
jgi:Fe2+ transport system protein B